MAKFEVYIPAVEPGGFNLTLKVGADNWMAALKAGMQKIGEQGAVSQNVMVDIQDDNSIHVTEALSGRVFRIRELSDDEVKKASVKRQSGIFKPARGEVKTELGLTPAMPPDARKTLVGTPAEGESEATKTLPPGAMDTLPDPSQTLPGLPIVAPPEVKTAPPPPEPKTVPPPVQAKAASVPPSRAEAKTLPPPPPGRRPSAKSSPRIALEELDVEELDHPVKPVTGTIGRPKSTPDVAASNKRTTDEMLADVFLRVTDLGQRATVEEAMQFILDLAMEKVPCESGSVLRADTGTGELTFVAARGPRAQKLLGAHLVIPAGEGIAGFCSLEGVSVALSDVQKDPRFYAAVGQKVDYETRSILSAPMMTHGRAFGCVQLINRKGGPFFLEHEVGVLAYLSHQAALYLNDRS